MIATVPVRKCAVCPNLFERRSTMHVVCSYPCTVKLAKQKERAAKQAACADRKATRAKLEAIKPRAQWQREAQTAFNAFIRLRDAALPCISCGRDHQGQWHAGHYLTTGARPELRFNEANCHKQCQPCNTHLHGNLVLYRVELIRRIGLAAVEALEGPHAAAKWTVSELHAIRDMYRRKAKALKAALEVA